MKHSQALLIASQIIERLRSHCDRIQIAGSIRRGKPEVKDIEIVCIPKPYDVGLFESGIATVVSQWPKVRGELPCKYTQRTLPEGIALDLFFATPENWANIYTIRTGSAAWIKNVMARRWVSLGYHSKDGILERDGEQVKVRTEEDLFALLGLDYVTPALREFPSNPTGGSDK